MLLYLALSWFIAFIMSSPSSHRGTVSNCDARVTMVAAGITFCTLLALLRTVVVVAEVVVVTVVVVVAVAAAGASHVALAVGVTRC